MPFLVGRAALLARTALPSSSVRHPGRFPRLLGRDQLSASAPITAAAVVAQGTIWADSGHGRGK